MQRKKEIIKVVALISTITASIVLANVPRSSEITNDTSIYQELHELHVQKVKEVDFNKDIQRLSALEKRHHEELSPRIADPMKRIQNTEYKYKKDSSEKKTKRI